MNKILITEDDDIAARIMTVCLKSNGYIVTRFTNGNEAFEYLKQGNTTDVLITDLLMPEMSGFELILKLNKENILPPTLVVTGQQREADALEAFSHGALDYMHKPVSTKILLAKIKAIIAMTKSRGSTGVA